MEECLICGNTCIMGGYTEEELAVPEVKEEPVVYAPKQKPRDEFYENRNQHRVAPLNFVPTTANALEITANIKKKLEEYDQGKPKYLRKHQYIINHFIKRHLTVNIPRGILLFYPMGTGKTLAFTMLAVTINRPVIAIMPKALVENAKQGIRQYCQHTHMDENKVLATFSFVSLDAYNMITEIERISNGDLNGYTIVVDEAHELFTQICNGNNKNGPTFYNMVMNAVDIFLIFATGTPIEKDPYEIVPMANMLAGRVIFPHDYKTFTSMYVGRIWGSVEEGDVDADKPTEHFDEDHPAPDNYMVPNRWLLQNRLVGLVSHTIANKARFPTELPVDLIMVPMIEVQWDAYVLAREAEIRENARNAKNGKAGVKRFGDNGIGKAQKSARTTFRQLSRALCNVYIDDKTVRHSPKMVRIAQDMTKWRRKTVAYSQFKEYGIYELARVLVEMGWEDINGSTATYMNTKLAINDDEGDMKVSVTAGHISIKPPDVTADIDEVDELVEDEDIETPIEVPAEMPTDNADHLQEGDKLYFAVLTGDTDSSIRKEVVALFNDIKLNMRGHKLCAVLVSRVGSRGINFIGGRDVIACESYWTYARFRQLNGRIRRDGSHLHLPAEEQTTQFHIYLSEVPTDKAGTEIVGKLDDAVDGTTSDNVIYARSLKRQYVLDEFMTVLKEVSIECASLKSITGYDPVDGNDMPINCYQCQGVGNEKLYSNDAAADLRRGNPCHKVVEKKLDLRKVTYDGKEYMYSKDPTVYAKSVYKIAIYYFDEAIERHRRMPENDERFIEIYKLVETS